ncbi:MAG: L-serine ammonia-lyase, iron-sulfur-dependent, subunit alpha [Clostridia bacterium]|nr:L-serine ammonia-lyase, iron-sulfur-dependent, subunit alpha [Clostridia bacterium]
MNTVKELYRIGRGPSSSHTMGPERACRYFRSRTPLADSYKVILYGSLADTGEGHGTSRAITDELMPVPVVIEKNKEKIELPHPNTLEMYAYKDGDEIDFCRVYSVGGGQIQIEGVELSENKCVYRHSTFSDIAAYCKDKKIRLWQYVTENEGEDILSFLTDVWKTMKKSIEAGLNDEGILPGGLSVQKKAKYLFEQRHIDESSETRENRLVCSYAFAVSEQNADCGVIVTAPTCGASGVLPAVLLYMQEKRGFTDSDIIKALATASVIGNLIKTNASISGAECGCQAEIGSACAMAAAGLGELFGMSIEQIEYAAEVALEHHLGLTCDPICGLVQIPCIERNAVAAMRAINAVNLANFLTDTRKISFDIVVKTMYETGRDMSHRYRETSEGGLAKLYKTE